MTKVHTIIEIQGRSDQGVTQPFRCRTEDGSQCYVKGAGAGRRSLICEWIAAHLGRAFGLPIPMCMLVEAPPELLALRSDGNELGTATAFASTRVDGCGEIMISQVNAVPVDLRRDVLVFDWWIRNLDRTLTEHGGNPNLLWSVAERTLVVIDHNNAFDPDFDAVRFVTSHVFSDQIPYVFHDLIERVAMSARLRKALESLAQACETIPAAWWFADDEQTVPVDIDIATVRATLDRCTHQDFWNLPL